MLLSYQGVISVRYPAGAIFAQGGKSICFYYFCFMLSMQS